jgi:exoribonuclease R
MLRKVHIDDRNYNIWKWFDGFSLEPVDCDINPLPLKLFTEDIIEIADTKEPKLVHSSVRQMKYMPGVLVLSGKTYGRYKDKLLYKCVPDDKRLPSFLIPYASKSHTFVKHKLDNYVTFSFCEWYDKHPIGKLTNNLGDVDNLNNFYEYQLYCKSLYASIQDFTKNTMEALKKKTADEYVSNIMEKNPQIQDRTEERIFTIDSYRSADFDDAVSIKFGSDDQTECMISIYISNVAIWMEELDLWNSFSERIATIYLPDRKRPMLPNILSDCLCSLQENNKRFTYCLDVYIKNNVIIGLEIVNCLINVYKNYKYEEESLLSDLNYKKLLNVVTEMCKNKRLISSIKDSHDVIAYLAILINCKCAETMVSYKNGVYRSVTLKNEIDVPDTLPEKIGKFIKIWNCSAGQYSTYSDQLGHILVSEGVESYLHISSPIRRLVDLLNSIKLQINLGIYSFGENANKFYEIWISKLNYINITMRAIRKVQNDCTLLDLISKDQSIKDKEFEGYVFDKIKRNDGLFQYIVYLHSIKVISRITVRHDLTNYTTATFKVYLLSDENTLKKKIRLQML